MNISHGMLLLIFSLTIRDEIAFYEKISLNNFFSHKNFLIRLDEMYRLFF